MGKFIGNAFWQSHRHLLISAFLLCYIYAVGLTLCPRSIWKDHLQAPVRPALRYLGLWQNYVTFAPAPVSKSIALDAVVRYADGTTKIWNYPRAEDEKGLDRFVKDKYRRLLYTHFLVDQRLWPAIARFAARQCDTPEKHPVAVDLVKHITPVPPLGSQAGSASAATQHETMYTCLISPDDLH